MALTKSQQSDVESVRYFIPKEYRGVAITEEDVKTYLEWSEEGKHKERVGGLPKAPTNGFEALVLGKSRRGLHVDLYEQGVLEGTMPYIDIFEDAPMSVRRFFANTMFKGVDKDLIMSLRYD